MKNNKLKLLGLAGIIILGFCFVTAASAQVAGQVTLQTNSATNIFNDQATLNGYIGVPYIGSSNSVYFQWGTTTNYGYQTPQQYVSSGSFTQAISGLSYNTTYHFRAVAQGSFGTIYGQDLVFNTNNYSNNYSNYYVQTNYASNVASNQATLNGNMSGSGNNLQNTYVWFQWGTDTNYGCTTAQQLMNNTGDFSQQITNLNYNTTYHYRAVAQGNFGTVYGQDVILNTSFGNGATGLSLTKQVINLTTGNLNWMQSISAKPGDTLSFAIALQANGQDVHNVFVRDLLPQNIVYTGGLMVNTQNYNGDITSGINIGTVRVNQPIIVSYHAQVAQNQDFPYGQTTLTNGATVTSTESGTQSASASVIINKTQVNGVTTVSTGQTNNPITDSFFFPILLIIAGSWFYFSGNAYRLADWIGTKI